MKSRFRRLVARQLEKRVKRLLSTHDIKVIAVTGSVGKTSTKLAIAHVLRSKYRVLAHEGNYNSEIGLPLSIFELDVPKPLTNPAAWIKIFQQIDRRLVGSYPYDVLVLEMGADQPDDIQKFMRYIRPDIGIITAIQPVHVEGFGSYENIVKEKIALAHGSNRVLVNAEDPGVMEASRGLQNVETYGLSKAAYSLPEDARLNTIGRPAKLAATAAYAAGMMLHIPETDIKEQLTSLRPFSGRMNVLSGKRGSTILDDTYNASPRAVMAALDTLYELKGVRKIAILGNMNELGGYNQAGHEEAGKACGKLDILLTIGQSANEYLADSAEKAGLKASSIHRFMSPYAAGLFLDDRLKKGDVVLVKGSQNGVYSEEAVALLLANPADKSQLVRQGTEWQARKKKQFGVE